MAEAQRREFFAQLHRWLRQGYAVHVFCNNDGERQRFTEIWEEYGLETVSAAVHAKPQDANRPKTSCSRRLTPRRRNGRRDCGCA